MDGEKETIQKLEALITIPTFSTQFLGLFSNSNLIVLYSVTHHLQGRHPFLSEYESYHLFFELEQFCGGGEQQSFSS